MDQEQLEAWVTENAERLDVPGVAVGILHDGEEQYAFHGVTSVENPLPVDRDTLFQFGSTGKTFTATAIMRLVEQGEIDLDATVRTYVPELELQDEDVAESVTVRHLLNHTAGWAGDLMDDTGPGDDALARYVEKMSDLEQVAPLGESVSYNNASLSLAGRVIEKVTGKTFEEAIEDLIFEPLGLEHCFFFPNDVMTRRFAVGHRQHPDGQITVARPWALPRGAAPAGGISSNAGDQIAWARFHLGDGLAPDGTRLLSEDLLHAMKEPTAENPGSAIGDAVGLSWMLIDVDGARLVEHGGTTNGQHSIFTLVPEHDFAIISLTNCGPNGPQFNDELKRWALETSIGVVKEDPEPLDLDPDELEPYTGDFETLAVTVHIAADDNRLVAEVDVKPELLDQLREDGEEVPDQPPFRLGLLPGDEDRFVVTDGPGMGMRGYFTRDDDGDVNGVHIGGRLATRMQDVPAPA